MATFARLPSSDATALSLATDVQRADSGFVRLLLTQSRALTSSRSLARALIGVVLTLCAIGVALLARQGGCEVSKVDVLVLKAVVVTFWEEGGELQPWVDGIPLDEAAELPGDPAWRLMLNRERRIAAVCTGVGAIRAAAAVTTFLHADARFDMSKAVWLLAGVAGVDPAAHTVGSAIFARFVVGGDLTRYVDPRERPTEWRFAWKALDKETNQTFQLSASLAERAHRAALAAGPLPDAPALQKLRKPYSAYWNAHQPPQIGFGDELATMMYWLGVETAEWARFYVANQTDGRGAFATSAMEDEGVLRALLAGWAGGRCRHPEEAAVVLRTTSDFVLPGANMSMEELIDGPEHRLGLASAIAAIRISGLAALKALVDL